MDYDENGQMSFSDVFLVMNSTHNHPTLSNLFKNLKEGSFTVDHALTITYNLLCAVNFLNSANLWHGNIKPNNVVITDQCNIILTDFRKAKLCSDR